jgi:hypothetical protein
MLDSTLIYCAVDLRIAIERYVFELLVGLYDFKLENAKEKRIKSLTSEIFKFVKRDFPDLPKRLMFVNHVLSVCSPELKTAIPDITWLERKRGNLSDYLHQQLRPEPNLKSMNKDFKEKGFILIKEIIERFREWLFYPTVWMPVEKMTQEVQDLYQSYITDQIDDNAVCTQLNLMKPVLNQRFMIRGDIEHNLSR